MLSFCISLVQPNSNRLIGLGTVCGQVKTDLLAYALCLFTQTGYRTVFGHRVILSLRGLRHGLIFVTLLFPPLDPTTQRYNTRRRSNSTFSTMPLGRAVTLRTLTTTTKTMTTTMTTRLRVSERRSGGEGKWSRMRKPMTRFPLSSESNPLPAPISGRREPWDSSRPMSLDPG